MSKLVLLVVIIALAFGINAILAIGVQYCAAALFHVALPFWPIVIGLYVLAGIVRGLRK